ncbi:putative flavoprotein reductase [Streptomyces sp. Tu6071]|nr:putative flavoprotein reductase [Streptomyces sp. Tu6071]
MPVPRRIRHVLHTDNDPQAHAGSPTASSVTRLRPARSIGA